MFSKEVIEFAIRNRKDPVLLNMLRKQQEQIAKLTKIIKI